MLNKKITSEIAIGIILFLAIVVGGIFYWQNKNSNQQPMISNQKIQKPEKQFCTEEAKLCDDGVTYVSRKGPNCEFAPCPESKTAQIANPASVYCEQNGGKSEIRTAINGSQSSYCKFDDGSECDEWAYFRNECGNKNADWHTYKNNEYGFEITFTDAWKGYKLEKENIIGGIADVIDIQLPTKDQKWARFDYLATSLKILIYTPQTWSMISKDILSPNYITKNDKYVFAYILWQDVPSDFGGSSSIAYKILEFDKIISSFKLIN